MKDPQEFLNTLKTELFEDEVYVFTPKGKILVLPREATPIDFAYSIHEEIGNHMVGCKINSKMMPIITKLKSGDIIEIMTSDSQKGPSRDWLKFIKTTKAKSKIQSWFKKEYIPKRFASGAYNSIVSFAFAICLSLLKYFNVRKLCNLSASFIIITLISFPIARNIFL